ncbi:LysR family transcriptional regulator [Orbus mooreae]|uniref:LysR family transcriptional regulator n=1 Tax=Orbus mooreae TaxID=3074107 RepID=UPI00370D9D54
MNLKKLKYFRVVAQELNFGHAAAKLYVDQSSLSRAIQSLESRLGMSLFERHLRQLKLTEHGHMLLQETNQIFYLIDSINHRINMAKQKQLHIIELAISPNIDGYRVAELLRIYQEHYPQTQLNIHEASYQNILYGLKSGQYHFALSLHKPSQESDALVFKHLWQEKLIALLCERHPLVSLPEVSLEDIKQYPFISFQPDTLLHKIIYNTAFSPSTTRFVQSYSVLQSLVMAGYGISLVTETMYHNMQSQHIVTRHIVPALLVDTYLIYQQHWETQCEQIIAIKKLVNVFITRCL